MLKRVFYEFGVISFISHVLKAAALPLAFTLVLYFFRTPREASDKHNGMTIVGGTAKYALRKTCTCDCWDGRFKGPYGRGHYKSIFFNMEEQTGYILTNVVVFFSFGEKALWRFLKLLNEKKVRISSAVILAGTLIPLWYGMWMNFNYINDRFYKMFYSQLFFTLTELVSAGLAMRFLDGSNKGDVDGPAPKLAKASWTIIIICIVHIIQSGADQMVDNLIHGHVGDGRGLGTRDLAFFLCDLTQLCAASFQLYKLLKSKREPENLDKNEQTSRYGKNQFRKEGKIAFLVAIGLLVHLQFWAYHKT